LLAAAEAPTPPDVPEPEVRPIDRLVSAIEVLFCSGLPSQLLLALLLQGAGWQPFDASGVLSLRYIAVLSLADTAIVVGLALMFLRSRGEAPRAVLLGARPVVREAWLGVALVLPILLGIGLVGLGLRTLAPWLHNVPDNPLAALARDPRTLAIFAAVVVLAGGVREEVQRAFVLHRFRQHLGGARLGLWLFSIAFGLGHLLQGYDAALLTAVLGLTWGLLYLHRGSVVAPMVSHAGFNLLEVLRQAWVS
jgi:membrane protease YdiL (CAAX protease family)